MEPESRTLEYKQEVTDLKGLGKTVIAFANGLGGDIIIGVQDRTLKVLGLPPEEIDDLLERIPLSMSDLIRPVVFPALFVRNVEGKEILVVRVYPGPSKPYYLAAEGLERGAYVRIGRHTKRAEGQTIEELRLLSIHKGYDEAPIVACPVSELNLTILPVSLRSKKALFSLDLIYQDPSSGDIFPTRGGVLMLHAAPERFVPGAEVLISKLRGTEGRSTVETHEIHGTLGAQAEQVEEILAEWLAKSPLVKGSKMVAQDLKLPRIALRESIHNALFHRQYAIPGATKIALYADRLEIFSPGHFAGPFIPDSLGDGTSYIRNRVVARLARRLGFIEKRGTGIAAIRDSMRSYGLIAPLFEEGPNWFKVTLSLIQEREVTPGSPENAIRKLYETHPLLSSSMVATALGVSKATAVGYLDKLMQARSIRKIGKGPATRYKLVVIE